MKLVIAAVVFLTQFGLMCWYGGYLFGQQGASRAADTSRACRVNAFQAVQERDRVAGEVQRLAIVGVDLVRFVDPRFADNPWAQVEFKLTNQTGKTINELDGSIRLYSVDHRLLGTVAANVVEPLTIGGSANGLTIWNTLDSTTRSALVNGTAAADYHADRVFYADGSIQRFTVGELLPDADFFPAQ